MRTQTSIHKAAFRGNVGNEILRGFTVIELLVSIAVISILVMILVPAVQAVRRTARATQCRNNLKQLGIALASYESIHKQWPAATCYGKSWQMALLPMIEHNHLAKRIDDSLPLDVKLDRLRGPPIPLLLCPDDEAATSFLRSSGLLVASTSYLANSGTGLLRAGFDGVFRNSPAWKPDLYPDGPVRPADVTDGLSATASVAEALHGVNDQQFQRLRTVWNTLNTYNSTTFDSFKTECLQLPEQPFSIGYVGSSFAHGWDWLYGNIGFSTYNHTLRPLSPSCFNGTGVLDGIYSAGSRHSVTHVLYCDGHVANTNGSVDELVWLALGSRNGSEPQKSN